MDTVSLNSESSGDFDLTNAVEKLNFGDAIDAKKSTPKKSSETLPKKDEVEAAGLNASLPQSFDVKYLGWEEAAGIWGIRYTRKPVDSLVSKARIPGTSLSSLTLTISEDGIRVTPTLASHQRGIKVQSGLFPIQSVSYGVQDLVYTRVFAMITVRDTNNILEHHPFRCHAYVCDSRPTARNLTFALASAFKLFSNSVKAREIQNKPKRFAIDLRTPEEIQKDFENNGQDEEAKEEVIDDSEA
ncbi:hypothetical protein CHUAL_011921 [Chamberlinius hualienensis]